MAINVICPGCMTRFQVSDRFAGKKGPCPKCGHIIEIPKEKLVVHAPEDITADGKTFKGGSAIHPILQSRFVFTTRQLTLAAVGVLIVLGLAWSLQYCPPGLLKNTVGVLGSVAIGFCLVSFGYMMVREEDDLEILLGHELHRRSFFTAVGFAATWIVLELLTSWLSPGPYVILYMIPIGILGAFIAVILFDTDVNKAGLLYGLFLIVMVLLRGLMFYPDGWIWQERVTVRPITTSPAAAVEEAGPSGGLPAAEPDHQAIPAKTSSSPARGKPASGRPKLDPRSAPDPSKTLKR